MMKTAKDKSGQEIFLRDKVSYEAEIDDMGLLGQEEGQVILVPEEGVVQVQPLGKKGGAPILMKSADVMVTYSLIHDIANLSTHEGLQSMVLAAETRYDDAVKAAKKPRKKRESTGSTRSVAKEEVTTTTDLSALMGGMEDML